jgi:hypothetical protein
MRNRKRIVPALSAALVFAACGGDDDDDAGGGGDTTTTQRETTTTEARTTTSAAEGGTAFLTFTASDSAPCSDGSAGVTMAYTTRDVVDISIAVNGGGFEETAGYGPNETGVVANLPCTAGEASEGSVQLKGCSDGGSCAESEKQTVQITG